MKRVLTAELIGRALDHAVAKANGWVDFPEDSGDGSDKWFFNPAKAPFCSQCPKQDFRPSTDWAWGGPIIEREKVRLDHDPELDRWMADSSGAIHPWPGEGPTPLIAVMRCIVRVKLGEWVDVPEELLA